jgi:DNA-directed RNA polymerase alpha subunit/DNA-directed RNA polymerase subunit L
MNPSITNVSNDELGFKFTLSNINVSLANAIRRTMLSDIPTLAFYTETHEGNECTIHENTTRLHNEILKHRLSCIPIHMTDHEVLPGNYILDVDVVNDTDTTRIVTSEDFRIRNKTTNNYLTANEIIKIFPPCPKTNMYIDFARLRPKIGNTIPGEKLKLTSEFSVRTAKDNSMFNVVSKCAYGNTVDLAKAKEVWEEHENTIRSEGLTEEELEIQKRNFYLLDANRHFKPDSFDFIVQSVGVYENNDILKKSCKILHDRLTDMIQSIDSGMVLVKTSETSMDYSYDIVLENEDYTIGKILEYILYEKFFVEQNTLTFCGFKKFHPHDDNSIIRVAYREVTDKLMVLQHLREVCILATDVFTATYKLF